MSPPSAGRRCSAAKAAHGVLILGPRAVERLESYTPDRPLPKVFRLIAKGKLTEGIFKGETINTPSMLAVEDAIFALEWAQGARRARRPDRALRRQCRRARPDRRGARLARPPRRRPGDRSKTSVCLTVDGADEALHQGDSPSCSRRRARPTTSPAIATPRRACASGAARPSTPPTSRRSGRGSTGPGGAERK